jgi:hypothetical protein
LRGDTWRPHLREVDNAVDRRSDDLDWSGGLNDRAIVDKQENQT